MTKYLEYLTTAVNIADSQWQAVFTARRKNSHCETENIITIRFRFLLIDGHGPVYLKTDGTTGRRDSLTGDDGTSNMFSHTNESTRPWTWRRGRPEFPYWAWWMRSLFNWWLNVTIQYCGYISLRYGSLYFVVFISIFIHQHIGRTCIYKIHTLCKYFIATYLNCVLTVITVKYFTMFSLFYQCRPYLYKYYFMAILVVCMQFCIHIRSVYVCVFLLHYFFSKIRCTRLLAANLKHDKNMEQSLVKLIHFWEWSMINIVGGFQRKARNNE